MIRSTVLAVASGAAALLLSGCVSSAVSLVTLPVHAASKTVGVVGGTYDHLTTSQAESDQKRGREVRRREERYGALDRQYRKASNKCRDGNRSACAESEELRDQMAQMSPSVPYEPR
ncbi:hypothetical protein [Novosphingobium lentum]|uniref:hypothetical protein n=1 Tax=Novosphingobium lentum TaxID=145287 RepID=UPI0008340DC3|nr:hypothetical protein [Novosphingobium lentum]